MAEKKTLLQMLGIGMARDAGEALSGREAKLQKQLQDALDEPDPKKRKKLSEKLGVSSE
jgi:hypothetical protein